jgi:hypothetical protein
MQAFLLTPQRTAPQPHYTASSHAPRQRARLMSMTEEQYVKASLALVAKLQARMAAAGRDAMVLEEMTSDLD